MSGPFSACIWVVKAIRTHNDDIYNSKSTSRRSTWTCVHCWGVLTQDYSILDMLTCSVTFWSKSEHNVGQSGIGGVYERVREWCSVWDNSPTKSAIHHSTHPSSFLFFSSTHFTLLGNNQSINFAYLSFQRGFPCKGPWKIDLLIGEQYWLLKKAHLIWKAWTCALSFQIYLR